MKVSVEIDLNRFNAFLITELFRRVHTREKLSILIDLKVQWNKENRSFEIWKSIEIFLWNFKKNRLDWGPAANLIKDF